MGTGEAAPMSPQTMVSVSPSGIAPAARTSRHSFDFPVPCGGPPAGHVMAQPRAARPPTAPPSPDDPCAAKPPVILSYPITLATVIVDGDAMDMKLPADPLPVPKKLPSVADMLDRTPDAVRHVAFEICGNKKGVIMEDPDWRVPSCGWYFAKYDAKYWGGAPFNTSCC